jgi:hypothetical protein
MQLGAEPLILFYSNRECGMIVCSDPFLLALLLCCVAVDEQAKIWESIGPKIGHGP